MGRRRPTARDVMFMLLAAVCPAMAQQVPPLESGPKIVDAEVVGAEVQLRDAETGKMILRADGYGPFEKSAVNGLDPQIEVQLQPSGYDMIYTFINDTGSPAVLGEIRVGLFTLGQFIGARDIHTHGPNASAGLVELDYLTHSVKAMTYPESIYSPLAVLQNGDYAVGISLQYPIMAYRHDAVYKLRSPGNKKYKEGEGGQGWGVEFRLSDLNPDQSSFEMMYPAELAPGEERTYVISVRVEKDLGEWIRTLVPYRNYFLSEFGAVDYERDARPIAGRTLALNSATSEENPYGWLKTPKYNADVHGFGAWAALINEELGDWPRVVLWSPAGVYRNNNQNNFPPQFTSRWLENEKLMTALDAVEGLPSIPGGGTELGLWWGRSLQIADVWDDPQLEPFDPGNPQHVESKLLEMDLAVAAGATMVGLDAFGHKHVPAWESVEWIKYLQDRYPHVRFATEPITSDFMHNMAPVVLRGHEEDNAESVEDLYRLKNPHYLADFLNPGHETWADMRYGVHIKDFGLDITPEWIAEDVEFYASMGFVPLMKTGETLITDAVAAESWLFTVPEDLQLSGDDDLGGDHDGPGDEGSGESSSDHDSDDEGSDDDGTGDDDGAGDDTPDTNARDSDVPRRRGDSSVSTFDNRSGDGDENEIEILTAHRDPVEHPNRASGPSGAGAAPVRSPAAAPRTVPARSIRPAAPSANRATTGTLGGVRASGPSRGRVVIVAARGGASGGSAAAPRSTFRRVSLEALRAMAAGESAGVRTTSGQRVSVRTFRRSDDQIVARREAMGRPASSGSTDGKESDSKESKSDGEEDPQD